VSRISVTPDQTAIISSITNLPLATANSVLPQQYQLGGTINAEIDVTRSGDDWLGSVDWQQADTVLYLVSPGQDPYEFQIPEAIVKVDFAEGGAEAEATLRVDPGVSIRTTAKLDSLTTNPLIEGRLRVDGDEWGWISSLAPEVANFGGDISADISASGPLLSPDLSGQASWLNGSADIPALNVPLTEINITASGAADGSATVNGGAMAGTGSIEISGQFADLMQADRRVELTITGEAADLMNWPDYQVKVSPDLVVVGTPGGWDARGTMEVPQAEIIVREIVENAVTVSPDIVAVSDDFSTPRSAARYSGEARLVLSDDVHIAAFGLDTNVSGELIVRKSPDNPIVDVTATRTIEDFDSTIVAGIRLRGRANNLNSTVYSEPAMAEADALSYLMIGRPLAEASNSEGSQLSGAALGLGLKQASRLTEQIGQSVGLDELTFIGDGGDATALVAGKQINSRLYARYAYGVFSRLGMILIRYRLSERLSLEAGSGETQSIDILYSVETE
jgi:translocation and assembly module TamB